MYKDVGRLKITEKGEVIKGIEVKTDDAVLLKRIRKTQKVDSVHLYVAFSVAEVSHHSSK